jgi:hypothetical protein
MARCPPYAMCLRHTDVRFFVRHENAISQGFEDLLMLMNRICVVLRESINWGCSTKMNLKTTQWEVSHFTAPLKWLIEMDAWSMWHNVQYVKSKQCYRLTEFLPRHWTEGTACKRVSRCGTDVTNWEDRLMLGLFWLGNGPYVSLLERAVLFS